MASSMGTSHPPPTLSHPYILLDGLGHCVGEHEAAGGARQDVKEHVQEAGARRDLDAGAAGAAQATGSWAAAAADLSGKQKGGES